MKKSRRLLHQFQTFIVSLLIVGSSVFLCVSIGVEAADSVSLLASQSVSIDDVMTQAVVDDFGISGSEELTLSSGYWARINSSTNNFVMASGLISDSVYKVELSVDCLVTPSVTGTGSILRSFSLIVGNTYDVINANAISLMDNYSTSVNRTYYLTGEFLMASRTAVVRGVVTNSKSAVLSLDFNFNIHVNSISEVSNASSDDYRNGYNAGFSDGESVGYGDGYSDGFSNGLSSVDTDSFFNNGYQAGVDSVDTDSFYDAGYQAGYDAAYTSGYDTGYDTGYQSAMSRIDGWGADSSEYPLFIYGDYDKSIVYEWAVSDSFGNRGDYEKSYKCIFYELNVNPTHTYRIDFSLDSSSIYVCSDAGYGDCELWLCVGSSRFPLHQWTSSQLTSCYVPGDCMSTTMYLTCRFNDVYDTSSIASALRLTLYNCNFEFYDCGPSGDTQNHIANQTDQLVNGFNDSQGSSVNDSFTSHVNDYNTAEDSLFTSAKTGLNNFQMFDLASVPAVVTGLSFVTSTMTSWFYSAGGADGVGIVLSVLFTVMIVAMALGLYKFYQGKHK